MKWFTSKRERSLWFATIFVVIGIYSTLGLAGQLADIFIEKGLFSILYMIGFGLTGVSIVAFGLLKKSRPVEWIIYLILFVTLIMMFTRSGISLVERTHLFEYGIVGVLIFNALKERGLSILIAAFYAFIITSLLGSFDEVIQFFLPNRVFDWLDILRNTVAGFVGVSLNALILKLREMKTLNK